MIEVAKILLQVKNMYSIVIVSFGKNSVFSGWLFSEEKVQQNYTLPVLNCVMTSQSRHLSKRLIWWFEKDCGCLDHLICLAFKQI